MHWLLAYRKSSFFIYGLSLFASIVCVGSIPEKNGDKIFNTCTVFGPNGDLLTKFRKVERLAKMIL